MKKIRLTESQLIDLIKKSVNKVKTINESQIINEVNYIDSSKLSTLAKNMIKNIKKNKVKNGLLAILEKVPVPKRPLLIEVKMPGPSTPAENTSSRNTSSSKSNSTTTPQNTIPIPMRNF